MPIRSPVTKNRGEAQGLAGPSAGAAPLREKGTREEKTLGLSLTIYTAMGALIAGCGS